MTTQKAREFFYFKIPVFFIDVFVHLSIWWLVLKSHNPIGDVQKISEDNKQGLLVILLVSFCLAISIFNLRLHERKIKLMVVAWRAFLQTITTYLIFLSLCSIVLDLYSWPLFFKSFAITLPVIVGGHMILNKLVHLVRKMGRNTRHVVIIGSDEVAMNIYRELIFGQSFTGYKVLGFFSSFPKTAIIPKESKLLGTVENSYTWLREHIMDEVYCSLPPATCSKEINKIIQVCNDTFANFYFVPNMEGYPHRSMNISQFGRVNVISLREEPLNTPWAKLLKRSFDIVASLLFLCTIFPFVYLFVWMGDLLTGSKGPVFFRQNRTGYNGKSFMIFKFRSMKVNAEADKLQATKDDPRKTKFGDFLRRSSIDELPQFINVLRGQMSIIGPRPHMEHHTEVYSELISNYMVRHLAKPGITGWAQINGCRGETKTVEEMKNRVEHDIWYIEHWTPLLDIEIFFKTIWQCLPGHDKQAY